VVCCLSCLFGVRIFISFSMRFKIMLNKRRRGPSALNISRRLLMSVLLNVFVSIAAVR